MHMGVPVDRPTPLLFPPQGRRNASVKIPHLLATRSAPSVASARRLIATRGSILDGNSLAQARFVDLVQLALIAIDSTQWKISLLATLLPLAAAIFACVVVSAGAVNAICYHWPLAVDSTQWQISILSPSAPPSSCSCHLRLRGLLRVLLPDGAVLTSPMG